MTNPLHNGVFGQSSLPLYVSEPMSLPTRIEGTSSSTTPKDPAASRRQLTEAGQQFEAYFISYLLKVMRETVPEGAVTGKYGAYFHSFYDQELGRRAAEAGGIGITQMVREHAETYFAPPPADPSSSSR